MGRLEYVVGLVVLLGVGWFGIPGQAGNDGGGEWDRAAGSLVLFTARYPRQARV